MGIPIAFINDTDVGTFWVELASAIFFAITTGFLIYEYLGQKSELKTWKKELSMEVDQMIMDSYENLRDHHHDLIRLQIEEPDLYEAFNYKQKPKEYEGKEISLNEQERKIFNLYLAEFDLFERVRYAVDDPKLPSVTEGEWITWLMYLEEMSHHWIFDYTYERTENVFEEKVMRDIKEWIIDKRPSSRDFLLHLSDIEETKCEAEDLIDKVRNEKKWNESVEKSYNESIGLYNDALKLYEKMLSDYQNESSLEAGKEKCLSRIKEIENAIKVRKKFNNNQDEDES